jgi:hypothetical protein
MLSGLQHPCRELDQVVHSGIKHVHINCNSKASCADVGLDGKRSDSTLMYKIAHRD